MKANEMFERIWYHKKSDVSGVDGRRCVEYEQDKTGRCMEFLRTAEGHVAVSAFWVLPIFDEREPIHATIEELDAARQMLLELQRDPDERM